MRIVIDTNVLFSALYDPASTPGRIILLAIEEKVELFAPATVRDELERALRGKLRYSDDEWEATLSALPVESVEGAIWEAFMERAKAAITDPDDAPVVALALALQCGIVSGDNAFHPLRKRIVKTWKPRDLKSPARSPRPTRRKRA